MLVPIKYEDYEFPDGRYEMDPTGRVYDNKFQCWLKPSPGTRSTECPDERYLSMPLKLANGERTRVLWHRLVAATFIGDVKGMQVHHKNHHPEDCYPENLEILSEFDHMSRHAHGESNNRAQLTEDDVRDVCQMLADGISIKEIARIMTERKGVQIIHATINQIRHGNNWSWISKDYDFYRGDLPRKGREPDKMICGVTRRHFEYLAAHKRLPTKEVAKLIGFDVSDPKVLKSFGDRVTAIRREYDSRMYKLIPKKQANMD